MGVNRQSGLWDIAAEGYSRSFALHPWGSTDMPKMKYLDLRLEVIATCLKMNEEGINQGTSGNVSVRTPEGFLITASGIPYHKMKPEHVVEMDLDGGYVGDYVPSTEWRMHLDIFKHRPEAQAIVHTHSIYATALACLRKDIPAFHYMIGIGGGSDIRCSEYAEFGTKELSEVMLKALEGRSPACSAITARSSSATIWNMPCGAPARSRRSRTSIWQPYRAECQSSLTLSK